MSRILTVVRMQLVMKRMFIGMPLLILGAGFALSWLAWALIPYDGPKSSGAAQAPLWYFLAIGVMSLTYTFPFSQALSVTRREFHLGTLLTAALTSIGLAAIYFVGGLAERATNGWGINGYYFTVGPIWNDGPFGAAVSYLVISLAFFMTGFWAATVYKRFGPLGLTATGIGLALMLVGAIVLVFRLDAWSSVNSFFQNAGVLGVAGMGAVLLAALGVVSYATLRRALP